MKCLKVIINDNGINMTPGGLSQQQQQLNNNNNKHQQTNSRGQNPKELVTMSQFAYN